MMKNKKNPSSPATPYLIMLASFIFRAFYVSMISIYKNQHDGGTPFTAGHLGYITYYINNNAFPNFDVSKVDQFWHPPLHYFLTANFLKAAWYLFPAQNGNYEIAQALPLLYVTLSIYLIHRSLRLLFPDDQRASNIALLFAAFQPSFLFRSATINNDALATLLTIAPLYVLLHLIKADMAEYDFFNQRAIFLSENGKYGFHLISKLRISKFFHIFLMMLFFILGMWTKKSVMLIAVPIGLVFLYEAFNGQKKNLITAIVLFVITLPISLGWYIWMYLKWNIPFNFVWNLEKPDMAMGYIQGLSPLYRILDFSPAHFKYHYVFAGSNVNAIDINPLTLLIKTSANDLWIWSYVDGKVMKLSYIILLLRILFTVIFAASLIILIADRRNKPITHIKNKLAIVSFTITSLVSFYVFAFQNPYICSMNYRYIEPIILCEAIFVGYLASLNRVPRWILSLLTLLLCVASVMKIMYF
ncbi:hypothetical protein [Butyrivibrio sp. YAB3001]|uniref:hypothetical protein n=1 Tax=Butyrivibrio sp. YAB3001 TaxID=1520812 RepID=UPI0008F67029|nr:hypothetical protein [Butyrivibrio sp. YAB3001]SFB95880.1 hypothetical protein SAMN02910398_01141 [Butyrivibrio sp. YAB3001]